MNGLPWNLILGNFIKICWESPNFVKIGQKCRALYVQIWVRCIAASDINSTLEHFCATLHIFILLAMTCSSGMHRECIYTFPLQQWLRERDVWIDCDVLIHCLYLAKYFSTWTVFNATQAKIIAWLFYGVSLLAVNIHHTCNMKLKFAYICFFFLLFVQEEIGNGVDDLRKSCWHDIRRYVDM